VANNRIIQLRKARGLTQRALADLAGTSQQQVQRIEAGVQGVRLELAMKIAAALGGELYDIFPSLAAPSKRKSRRSRIPAEEKLLEAGIDPDPVHWTVKLFANDGRVFLYQLSSNEKSRLEKIVSAGETNFVTFIATSHYVALNLKKFAATQFLFDFGIVDSQEKEGDYKLSLHLSSVRSPIVFGVDPDQKSLEDGDESQSQLQNIFATLDSGLEDEVVWFDDVDGERVYIRPIETMLIEAPLICCDPALWSTSFDGYLEDEAEKNPTTDVKEGD